LLIGIGRQLIAEVGFTVFFRPGDVNIHLSELGDQSIVMDCLDVVRLGQLKPPRQKNRHASRESGEHHRACPAWFHVLGLQTGFLFDHRLLKSVAHGDIIP